MDTEYIRESNTGGRKESTRDPADIRKSAKASFRDFGLTIREETAKRLQNVS